MVENQSQTKRVESCLVRCLDGGSSPPISTKFTNSQRITSIKHNLTCLRLCLFYQELHQISWSDTLEARIRVCRRERSRGTYTLAVFPLYFVPCHYTILNFDEVHLFLLLGPPEVMLYECSASIIVSFEGNSLNIKRF